MQIYLDRGRYDKLIDALLAIEPDSFTGRADTTKIILGEVGDIWPDGIQEDSGDRD